MTKIPEINGLDLTFGNIKHMPKYESVPQEFKSKNNPYCAVISKWFFAGLPNGLSGEGLAPKPGIDQRKATAAIAAILRSFEPKHEHKEAGAAMLLSEWFEFKKSA